MGRNVSGIYKSKRLALHQVGTGGPATVPSAIVMDWLPYSRRFILDCTYSQNATAKIAGFVWDRDRHHWFTTDPERAAKLIRYATSSAKAELAHPSVSQSTI